MGEGGSTRECGSWVGASAARFERTSVAHRGRSAARGRTRRGSVCSGREREAQILGQLASKKPDYPMVHVMLAQAILKSPQPDYAKALAALERAEKAAPEDSDVFELRAKALSASGQTEKAAAALRRAIEL